MKNSFLNHKCCDLGRVLVLVTSEWGKKNQSQADGYRSCCCDERRAKSLVSRVTIQETVSGDVEKKEN